MNLTKKFFTMFILLSFITRTIGTSNSTTANTMGARITYADMFGFFGLLFGIPIIFKAFNFSQKFSKIYIGSIIMIASFLLPVYFSLNVRATLLENLIILFLALISMSIFYNFKDSLFDYLFPALIVTTLIASFLGFYDIVASFTGLPRIFRARTDGEVISGFRNAGQAGAYFMVFLAILFPLRQSELKNKLSKRMQRYLNYAIFVSILFLFSTGKIAAYIGFVIGITLYLFKKRDVKNLLTIGFFSAVIFVVFLNLEQIAPILAKRINHKIKTRVTENIDGTSQSSFFENNWGGALKAFSDRPITGTGLGGFWKNYGNYEVHSTYLKMLGETGLIGTFGYVTFMILFMLLFRVRKSRHNPYSNYMKEMFPFVLGCIVSWSYTYHLRKREFWILLALLLILKYNAEKWNYEKYLQFNKNLKK